MFAARGTLQFSRLLSALTSLPMLLTADDSVCYHAVLNRLYGRVTWPKNARTQIASAAALRCAPLFSCP